MDERTTRVTISIPKWIIEEILKDSGNRSSRIEELLIKGYMAEREGLLKLHKRKDLSNNEQEAYHHAPLVYSGFIEPLIPRFGW